MPQHHISESFRPPHAYEDMFTAQPRVTANNMHNSMTISGGIWPITTVLSCTRVLLILKEQGKPILKWEHVQIYL